MIGFDEFLTFQSLPWRVDAACRGLTNLMFPERGDSLKEAKKVCASCPVRGECLDYAMSLGKIDGVWGGTTGMERRAIRSAMRTEETRRGRPKGEADEEVVDELTRALERMDALGYPPARHIEGSDIEETAA